jgi:hypothetical protein
MIYFSSTQSSLVAGIVASVVSISVAPSLAQTTIEQQLLGTWQADIIENGEKQKVSFIFASGNKLSLIGPKGELFALKYQINPQTQPLQIDIIRVSEPKEKVLTILEITKDGSLKMQVEGVQPNQPRPTAFDANPTIFTKISNSTVLPSNAVKSDEPIDKPTVATNRLDVIDNISKINKSQTAFYAEKKRFATSFDELALGNISGKTIAQTTDYSYHLLIRNNRAYVTAKAKTNNLKSYVGAVFIYFNPKNSAAHPSIICETEKPTKTLSRFPRFVGGSNPVKCPVGTKAE